jgi:hypothetical protein
MNIKTFRKILGTILLFSFVSTTFFAGGVQITQAESAAAAAKRMNDDPGSLTAPDNSSLFLKSNAGMYEGVDFNAVNSDPVPRAIIVDENKTSTTRDYSETQANAAVNGSGTTNNSINLVAGGGNYASCLAAGAISGVVKKAVQKTLGSVLKTEVPNADAELRGKDTGLVILGVPFPSWDQIGWCLANSVLESIGDATVAWINSGFQGNPAFVTDPSRFFLDIADQQAGAFLGEISNGFLCGPIKNIVRVNLASNYNNSMYAPRCTFSAVSGNLEQFMSGETFSWDDWMSYTQNPSNNPFGATLAGQIELDQRIAASLGVQSTLLEWGGGWLSHTDPKTGKITSPGSMIQDVANQRLGSGQRRLEIADEFDEITTALVNQLIKTAINEITQQGN